MPRVVLDPGVVVSGLLNSHGPPGRLLRAWRDGAFEWVVSRRLLVELTEVLERPKLVARFPSDAVSQLPRIIPEAVTIWPDPSDIPAVCRDPDDDYLLALAQRAGALLVSGDRDVLSVSLRGLTVLTPTEAADRLVR